MTHNHITSNNFEAFLKSKFVRISKKFHIVVLSYNVMSTIRRNSLVFFLNHQYSGAIIMPSYTFRSLSQGFITFSIVTFSLSWISVVNAAPTFGNQSSTKNVEWDFDFVERFDGMQDWVSNEGRIGNTDDVSKMPKLLDGSDSAWGYFSMWGDGRTPPDNWIGSHDYENNLVWQGSKSVAIDIGDTAYGPSRFGLYMGEGYEEFYLFFMVNIPKNEFPTSCEGGSCQADAIGIYTPGEDYAWYSSWKFTTFNIDCPSAMCPDRNTYSDYWAILSHVKQYNYGTAPGITLHVEADDGDANDKWASDGNMNLNPYLGNWFGLEYHVTQNATTTDWDIWFYDQNGNATKLMDNKSWPTPDAAQGRPWNQIFFGGNNSDTYTWGPTMKSPYYIDDVIVDDKRIGPKYFSFINGDRPNPPSNLNLTIKQLSKP